MQKKYISIIIVIYTGEIKNACRKKIKTEIDKENCWKETCKESSKEASKEKVRGRTLRFKCKGLSIGQQKSYVA